MIVITCALWVPPQLHGMQRNDARKTLYDYVFKGWMTSINQHLANYFWTRTRMDYLSSILVRVDIVCCICLLSLLLIAG